ncbi:MAG: hypothetical protein WEB88_13820 [Gemmatimonadota bacterium]
MKCKAAERTPTAAVFATELRELVGWHVAGSPSMEVPATLVAPLTAPGDARRVLDGYREKLAFDSPSDPTTLRAMQDTTTTFHGMAELNARDRGLTVFISGNVSCLVSDRSTCLTWAGRAVAADDSRVNGTLRPLCESIG